MRKLFIGIAGCIVLFMLAMPVAYASSNYPPPAPSTSKLVVPSTSSVPEKPLAGTGTPTGELVAIGSVLLLGGATVMLFTRKRTGHQH